jgi:hypothetical protein
MRRAPGLLGLVAGLLAVGCGAPGIKTATSRAPRTDASAGMSSDEDPARPTAPDAGLTLGGTDVSPPASCAPCGPGQSCLRQACVDDCRPADAVACAAPTTCDFLSGHCVPPGSSCVLTGPSVSCGGGEFPPRCGPGARCEAGQGCIADGGCMHVVCDASNFCRGTDCPMAGGGGVHQVTLAPLPDTMAGAAGGVMAQAMIAADGLCGLTATFELRKDLELFVSAYNDKGIWRIPVGGMPSHYITETEPIGGVTADRSGTLYYTLQSTGAIRRVPATAGTPMPQTFATLASAGMMFYSASLARMTFGPDGLLYAVAGQNVYRLDAAGMVTKTWNIPQSSFLTGIAFEKDGSLLAAQHWSTVWRLPPAGDAFVSYVDARPMVPPNTNTPWNEGMALGPDGSVHVGIFPSGNLDGVVYAIAPGGKPTRLLGLPEMRRDVPATEYAGVHGVAFGVDGTLYFANQNTAGPTSEPRGQVLARRPSGKIELVAAGLNFDWPRGYDGDIVVSQATMVSVSAAVDDKGHAQGSLDAPKSPGVYGVRVLVTDPRTGAITEARGSVVVR